MRNIQDTLNQFVNIFHHTISNSLVNIVYMLRQVIKIFFIKNSYKLNQYRNFRAYIRDSL